MRRIEDSENRRDDRERVAAEIKAARRGSVFGSCLQVVGLLVVGLLMVIGVANLIAPGRFPTPRPTATLVVATPTPIIPIVIERVRALSRLETMQYSMEWVIDERRDVGGIVPGSERLLLIVHGQVVAGIDLAKLDVGDLTADGSILTLRLPAAEVLSIGLNNERSYVYDYQKDWWIKGQPVELVGDALVRAEREIGRAAIKDGILDKAMVNAQTYLRGLLGGLGFSDIQFVVPTPTATPSPTVNLTPVAPQMPIGTSAPPSIPVTMADAPAPTPTPAGSGVPTPRS